MLDPIGRQRIAARAPRTDGAGAASCLVGSARDGANLWWLQQQPAPDQLSNGVRADLKVENDTLRRTSMYAQTFLGRQV